LGGRTAHLIAARTAATACGPPAQPIADATLLRWDSAAARAP
jgi:hypothetical protein